jgi:predicted ATPase
MARLDRIEIDGYRSIRELRLELGALNILIGANGSGKSNLIGALGLLGDLVENQLQLHVGRRGGANALLHFGQKKTKRLRIHVRFGEIEYEAVLEPAAGDTFFFASERTKSHAEGESVSFGAGHKESLDLEEDRAPRATVAGRHQRGRSHHRTRLRWPPGRRSRHVESSLRVSAGSCGACRAHDRGALH